MDIFGTRKILAGLELNLAAANYRGFFISNLCRIFDLLQKSLISDMDPYGKCSEISNTFLF